MNLFLKQISTIFFSLFFFLLSGEAWGATDVFFPLLQAGCLKTEAPCSSTCVTQSNQFDFRGTRLSGTTYLVGSYTTNGTPDTDNCRIACSNFCTAHKINLDQEKSGELVLEPSTSSNTFSKSICNAFRIATGSAGKTFAAFAIIATGIGFFSGKVSWGLMIGVAAGIATMFGAPSIVAAISGSVVDTKCTLATGMSGG